MHMYVYMHNMYVCMCVLVYECICVACVYVRVYMSVYALHVCAYEYMYAMCTYVYMCACVYERYVYMHVNVFICAWRGEYVWMLLRTGPGSCSPPAGGSCEL